MRTRCSNVAGRPALLPPIVLGLILAAIPAAAAIGRVDRPDQALLRELAARRAACSPEDVEERVELAAWAERESLHSEAEVLYREAIDRRPDLASARAAVARLASRRALPVESRALETARRQLGDGFTLTETVRFAILSDTDGEFVRELGDRLERAATQFDRFARRIDLDPLPLGHKLVCVLFADREEYRAFANEHDGVTDEWIAGYYAPRTDRIVFYHGENNPSVREARRKLAAMAGDLAKLEARLSSGAHDPGGAIAKEAARKRDHLRRETERVDAFARDVSVATTTHECVHQLLFHTRIQSPFVHYPLWICEGLATAFETETPKASFGPDCEFAPRRARFVELLAREELIPVRELVSMTTLGNTADVDALYHQSYALVTWMNRSRSRELRSYLQLLRAEPAGRPSAGRMLEIFEQAFGPADVLERAWARHERSRLLAEAGER